MIALTVSASATIVLWVQTVVPMLAQWDAFMERVPMRENVCATMVFEAPIVPSLAVQGTATAMDCAVVPFAFAVLVLLVMIAVLCRASMHPKKVLHILLQVLL